MNYKRAAILAAALLTSAGLLFPPIAKAAETGQPAAAPSSSSTQSTSSGTSTVAKTSRTAAKKSHHIVYRHRYVRRRIVVHRVARTSRHRIVRRRIVRRRVAVRRAPVRHIYRRVRYTRRRVIYRRAVYGRYTGPPWFVSSYTVDPAFGDDTVGDDPTIREAAIKALGHWNGSVVVVDPNTGRILTIVNQKLALTRGYIPCSTVKPMVALAGLAEHVVNLNTRLRGMWGRPVDMTEALAHSDNEYFAHLGELLGFDRVEEYAHELGYGQKAAIDILGESPGVFPSAPPPPSEGGVGKLTSFGQGIDQTPLQVAAVVSAIANGGTLYYLQYPRTPEEIAHFKPIVRRRLTNLLPYIPEVRDGMAATVLYGTARLAYNPEESIYGKTGTCSEDGGRMGWFISYAEGLHPRYVVIVELRGGEPMYGPHAAQIAGVLYRSLLPVGEEASTEHRQPTEPAILVRPGGS